MTQEMLVGTTLESIPTVSVSAITGAGIALLKQTIVKQVSLKRERGGGGDGIPRPLC